MARCEVCGNEYDKAFEISLGRQIAFSLTASSARFTRLRLSAPTAAAKSSATESKRAESFTVAPIVPVNRASVK